MLRTLVKLLSALFFLQASMAYGQCPGSSPLTIDNIITTEMRCPSSATANAIVSGGVAPYSYAITAGPRIVTPQSSSLFNALPAGLYTMRVTDNCGNNTTRDFQITGSYTVTQLTNVLRSPSCTGNSDGAIEVNVTAGGRAPFTYELIAPSPIIRPVQTSNLFDNLPIGRYTYRVKDSCGNVQTRTVNLLDNTNNNFLIVDLKLNWVACDSFYVAYRVTSDAGANFSMPYESELQLPNGSVIKRVVATPSATILDTFRFRYGHLKSVDPWLLLTVYNGCRVPRLLNYRMPLDMSVVKEEDGSCSGLYRYIFDQGTDNNPAYPYNRLVHCGTITYSLINPSGTVVATQVNNSTFSGFPPGIGYKVVRETCCNKDTLEFDWATMPFHKLTYNIDLGCKEGTAVLRIQNNGADSGIVVIESGPASVTFVNGVTHTYTYPDTIRRVFSSSASIVLGYLTEGSYRMYYISDCGHKDTANIVILPAHLKRVTFNTSLVKGCLNDNKIVWEGTGNFRGADNITITKGTTVTTRSVSTSPFKDSVVNLAPASYTVEYLYRNYRPTHFVTGMAGLACDKITAYINVPNYTQPFLRDEALVGRCASDRLVSLLPDSSSGVLPFWYDVLAGPVIPPGQSNPLYTNLPQGTYTVRVTDACGNSYSDDIDFDSLIKPTLDVQQDCQFETFTAFATSSPSYDYHWIYPDGTALPGGYLGLWPYTINDAGTYRLVATSILAGCIYTEDTSITLTLCSLLPTELLSFKGSAEMNAVSLQWKIASTSSVHQFIPERSADGKLFMPLGSVPAKESVTTYRFTDQHPLAAKAWYRLQLVDNNGSTIKSKAIVVDRSQTRSLRVYPVPVDEHGQVYLDHPVATTATCIEVADLLGRVMIRAAAVSGTKQSLVDISKLPAGSYLLIYRDGRQTQTVKLLKK